VAKTTEQTTFDHDSKTIVVTPALNACRFKRHRFTFGGYASLRRDALGRYTPKAQTMFLVEHCADPECLTQRLTTK
jgi:hypothetical protein